MVLKTALLSYMCKAEADKICESFPFTFPGRPYMWSEHAFLLPIYERDKLKYNILFRFVSVTTILACIDMRKVSGRAETIQTRTIGM